MGKAPTIYDVSRLAGVSTTTISRVLNRPEMVNSETRRQVEQAIKELDYKPLVEARLRNNNGVTRICVCAPRFTDSSFVQRLRGITSALDGDPNFEMQVFSVRSKLHFDRFINSLPLRGLDGLILLSIPLDGDQLGKIQSYDVQMTCVEFAVDSANCIIIDDTHGGHLAGDFLAHSGRRKFGVVGEWKPYDFSVYPNANRLQGYLNALEENGFTVQPAYIYDVVCSVHEAYHRFLEIFKKGDFPEAIFALSDDQAIGICRAARECGVRIPDDLAVVGFDDIEFSEYFGLTTIRQHLDESGRLAVALLKNKLRCPESVPQLVNLPLELIERTTV